MSVQCISMQLSAPRQVVSEWRVDDGDDLSPDEKSVVLANVQMATGTTRREARSRLMRAFNTPFFPDILVCSQVMGEGVDLQRFCRHVIHHDLDWNPSTIEQRTGRIDRLGARPKVPSRLSCTFRIWLVQPMNGSFG